MIPIPILLALPSRPMAIIVSNAVVGCLTRRAMRGDVGLVENAYR